MSEVRALSLQRRMKQNNRWIPYIARILTLTSSGNERVKTQLTSTVYVGR